MYPSPVTMYLHSPLQSWWQGSRSLSYTLKTWYSQPSINKRSFLICEQYFKRNTTFCFFFAMYFSNLLVPNPTNKIHHNLSRKRMDRHLMLAMVRYHYSFWRFLCAALSCSGAGVFQGSPWPLGPPTLPKWAPNPVVFSWSYGMLWGPNVLIKCVTMGL